MSASSRLARFRQNLRALAGFAFHYPERWLHSRRRARARRLIEATGQIRSVVFVCYGNVCRSPFAMEIFAKAVRPLNGAIGATSVGFIGPGRQPPPQAIAAADARGVDIAGHRSRIISGVELTGTDLIVVMDVAQRTAVTRRFGTSGAPRLVLGDLDPKRIQRRTIVDPWGCDDATFASSYDRIVRCVGELAQLVIAKASRGED